MRLCLSPAILDLNNSIQTTRSTIKLIPRDPQCRWQDMEDCGTSHCLSLEIPHLNPSLNPMIQCTMKLICTTRPVPLGRFYDIKEAGTRLYLTQSVLHRLHRITRVKTAIVCTLELISTLTYRVDVLGAVQQPLQRRLQRMGDSYSRRVKKILALNMTIGE